MLPMMPHASLHMPVEFCHAYNTTRVIIIAFIPGSLHASICSKVVSDQQLYCRLIRFAGITSKLVPDEGFVSA